MKKLAVSFALVLTTSILISPSVFADTLNPDAVTTAEVRVNIGSGKWETIEVPVYESADGVHAKSTSAMLKPKINPNTAPTSDITKSMEQSGKAKISPSTSNATAKSDGIGKSAILARTDANGKPDKNGTESITVTNVVSIVNEKIVVNIGDSKTETIDATIYEITNGSQIIPASADKKANVCVYGIKYDTKTKIYTTARFVNFPKLSTLDTVYTDEDNGMLSQFAIYSKDVTKLKGSIVGSGVYLRIVPKK